jgi:hypothetical protein
LSDQYEQIIVFDGAALKVKSKQFFVAQNGDMVPDIEL